MNFRPPTPHKTSGFALADAAGRLRQAAQELGFVAIGFAPVERFSAAALALETWLQSGNHGEMAYLAHGPDRANPLALLGEAKTVIVVGLPYGPSSADQIVALRRSVSGSQTGPNRGMIAGYAVGADYHVVLKEKLARLADICAVAIGRPVLARACVDTAPLLEREAARRAGLGFIGKNTMLIAPRAGSRLLLGELLIDAALPSGQESESGCGRCTACLEACPTAAFIGPYILDARRCISYLTIELRGPIPKALRRAIGTRVFGCDICQDVCPYNASGHAPRPARELEPRAELSAPDLVGLLELGSAAYRKLVRGTALRRVSRTRLARNAAVALGNSGDLSAVAALSRVLRSHSSALVRAHAAWALGEIGGELAVTALADAMTLDSDESVRREAKEALDEISQPSR
jgi:epoxyqueuosine reductase